MLKPGQLFSSNRNTYQVTKGAFEIILRGACSRCRLYYNVHLNVSVPCETYRNFPCTEYCGMRYYPKLVKLCGNKDYM